MSHYVFTTVGITIKPSSTPEFHSIIPNLCSWFHRRHIQVIFRQQDQSRILKFLKNSQKSRLDFWEDVKFHREVDLMISLGGDGTLIGLCRRINRKIPILGINLGRLGFITEFNKTEFFDHLDSIFKGNFVTSLKPLCQINVLRKNKRIFNEYFFNDAVVATNDIARMIYLRTELGEEHVYNLAGDGIIISTPLGSTAYSMAAGGPIVHPEVEAFVITPICPHSLVHRPFVVPNKQPLRLKILPPYHSVTLTLDGQVAFQLEESDVVTLNNKRMKKIALIQNPMRHYFETIRDKFVYSQKN